MGLAVGLHVDVGLCGLLNTAGAVAVLWSLLFIILLSARSLLKHQETSNVTDILLCLINQGFYIESLRLHQPFLQCQSSVVAALAFDGVYCWSSSSVV